ncbi:Probable NAD-glutamate dehydrogenase [Mycobacteroides abscessus subsp. bolletii]|nr:Probable NAD-glutamate dehydrogenase [Mycobacteroides abscessus subsp. bolletii]SKV46133.1 Probable NAD-glutamate dehydrogenase [Mycobacteroides abscessus subsp. abscessus]SHW54966.1 Probable NAD-glutamate dehydrogenase [Mycobacteroides abscessus subsp. bolletii]SHX46264.1 Probable NAD-glutamate dehydrogenase [Mycobacteroides abscessus subsp. bolletii]SKS13115.1 Probable NAD-glutamate dehydrogenase [Mycobacteroides abscessus subsp. bolletii]
MALLDMCDAHRKRQTEATAKEIRRHHHERLIESLERHNGRNRTAGVAVRIRIADDPAFVSALSAYFPDSWQCGLLTDGITEHRLTELPRHIDGCQSIAPERISRLKEVVARSRRDGFVDVPRAAAISAELSSLCRRAGG